MKHTLVKRIVVFWGLIATVGLCMISCGDNESVQPKTQTVTQSVKDQKSKAGTEKSGMKLYRYVIQSDFEYTPDDLMSFLSMPERGLFSADKGPVSSWQFFEKSKDPKRDTMNACLLSAVLGHEEKLDKELLFRNVSYLVRGGSLELEGDEFLYYAYNEGGVLYYYAKQNKHHIFQKRVNLALRCKDLSQPSITCHTLALEVGLSGKHLAKHFFYTSNNPKDPEDNPFDEDVNTATAIDEEGRKISYLFEYPKYNDFKAFNIFLNTASKVWFDGFPS